MSANAFDRAISDAVKPRLDWLKNHFDATVIFYAGSLFPSLEIPFRDFLERERAADPGKKRLVIVLNTMGGSAETTEKLVEIIRHHYEEVYFIVPDSAMSAGTIFCMSGDKIYMEYSSSLGPIDPQVRNREGQWVPALGYLDQVNEFIAKGNGISATEISMIQNLDIATLSRYQQAKNLTITLLKKWLVEYKFRNWLQHRSNPDLRGQPVTLEQKQKRAEEIAEALSNNKKWHSHGRLISLKTISELRLEIEDYTEVDELRENIRGYHDLLIEYLSTKELSVFLHGQTRL